MAGSDARQAEERNDDGSWWLKVSSYNGSLYDGLSSKYCIAVWQLSKTTIRLGRRSFGIFRGFDAVLSSMWIEFYTGGKQIPRRILDIVCKKFSK